MPKTAVVRIEFHVAPAEKTVQRTVQHQVFGRSTQQSVLLRHQPQAVGQQQRLIDVVRRQQHGLMLLARQAVQQVHHLDPADNIQKSGRLVE